MGIYHHIYIGHVKTINLEAYGDTSLIESKVVALRLVGKDHKHLPKYQPLRPYKEYYSIERVEPIVGLVSDTGINKALKQTGKPEVKQLRKIS